MLIAAASGAHAQVIPERPGGSRPVSVASPRIPPLPESQWSDTQRALVAKYGRDGRAGNDLRTLLHVPQIVDAVMPFRNYLSNESSLSPRHRELLILRTAWLCGSDYLWGLHAARARRLGMTADDLRRVASGPDAAGWDAFDATLLRLADQLYRNSSVNDATWKALTASYDLYNMMDAVMTVGDFMMLSTMFNSMGVQPDEGVNDHLPADIPYRVSVPEPEPALRVARVEPLAGPGIAVGRTFDKYPKLAEPRQLNTTYVNRQSKLPPRIRELLILRIGWNTRSEYEWSQHVGNVGRAREHGLEPRNIALGPDAPGWDPFEATLLRAVDELYRDAIVSDSTWKTLSARYDTTSLMNVLISAANYRMVSIALNAFGVQHEPGDEPFPQIPLR